MGIFITDAHGGGPVVGNQVHDNCAGIWFEAFGPVGGFEVKGNTVTDNTHSCQGPKFDQEILGDRDRASRRQRHGRYRQPPLGQRPLRAHPYLGRCGACLDGSVLRRDGETQEQHRHRQPLWPQQSRTFSMISSGSGNRFIGNHCNTSVPIPSVQLGRFHFYQEGPASAGLFFLCNLRDLPLCTQGWRRNRSSVRGRHCPQHVAAMLA